MGDFTDADRFENPLGLRKTALVAFWVWTNLPRPGERSHNWHDIWVLCADPVQAHPCFHCESEGGLCPKLRSATDLTGFATFATVKHRYLVMKRTHRKIWRLRDCCAPSQLDYMLCWWTCCWVKSFGPAARIRCQNHPWSKKCGNPGYRGSGLFRYFRMLKPWVMGNELGHWEMVVGWKGMGKATAQGHKLWMGTESTHRQ